MIHAAKIHRIVFVLILVAGGCAPPAAAEDSAGRDADACQGDIHRLCDRYFPDETLVANCLVEQRANLSQACAEVLARPSRGGGERN